MTYGAVVFAKFCLGVGMNIAQAMNRRQNVAT